MITLITLITLGWTRDYHKQILIEILATALGMRKFRSEFRPRLVDILLLEMLGVTPNSPALPTKPVVLAGKDLKKTEKVKNDVNYEKMKVVDLKAILRQRKLPLKGKKADLVARLKTDDLSNTPVDNPNNSDNPSNHVNRVEDIGLEIKFENAKPGIGESQVNPAVVKGSGEDNVDEKKAEKESERDVYEIVSELKIGLFSKLDRPRKMAYKLASNLVLSAMRSDLTMYNP